MVNIEFNFNQKIINIQANLDELFKIAVDKYIQKTSIDPTSVYFLANGKTLNLKLHDDATNEDKEILCVVKREGNDDAVELDCNTNGQNIDAYLYFKRGMEGTTKIFLNMTDEKAKIQITDVNSTTTSYHVNYRKSSSGLSGGAIVGIVIAYAVALIAASIAAMMLRKPMDEQPINHTTAVQLRTVKNI